MTAFPYHRHLSLTNFTVFKNASFDFVPGINAFIGENGTGKTHLMKALYAVQRPLSRDVPSLLTVLERLFQTNSIFSVLRSGTPVDGLATVSGIYHNTEWNYLIKFTDTAPPVFSTYTDQPLMERPVFIPAIDMMSHTKGFQEAYNSVFLDFDLTCADLVTLFALKSRMTNAYMPLGASNIPYVPDALIPLLGGEIIRDDRTGRFFLDGSEGRIEMPMIAEGLRKIATLVHLINQGWLVPGASLFWDEPEVNLNPVIMDEVIGALLALARSGIQIFLATHSYIMLRELDVQSRKTDTLRYFALSRTNDGVTVSQADSYLDIAPNPIERQYADLYDRSIAKRLNGGV